MRRLVDLHNHLLPGVDDGSRSLPESLAGLRSLHEGGVRQLAVTPHAEASVLERPRLRAARLSELDQAWESFRAAAQEAAPGVELTRGLEVMLDLPTLDTSDPLVRLGGGPHILVEFPQPFLPPNTSVVLARIRESGVRPVVAHPERYEDVRANLGLAAEWRRAGAILQMNGASLLGWYGRRARQAALELLRSGMIDYIASDYHARGRPGINEYRAALVELGGEEYAGLLLEENPARVLRGEALFPVPPQGGHPSLRDRIRSFLGRR